MTFMYANTTTWNPYKGCKFNCVYCKPSFQRQAKRQKHHCIKCYNYEPHYHPERLTKIPKAELVFACGNGDISFAFKEEKESILKAMRQKTDQVFLLQTKDPECMKDMKIPTNTIIGTTIETNRDTSTISEAPTTEKRYKALKELDCRKAVTIEPILDFDLDILLSWLTDVAPEIVWIGYANHTNSLNLSEPELSKTRELIHGLRGISEVRLKTIRDRVK